MSKKVNPRAGPSSLERLVRPSRYNTFERQNTEAWTFQVRCRYKISYLLRFRGELLGLFFKQLFQLIQFCVLRLRLLKCEMQMITHYGLGWRSCVFDDQVVELLKVFDDFHFRWWWHLWPNDPSSATWRPGPGQK